MKTVILILFILLKSVIFSQDSISEYYEEVTSGSELSASKNKFRFYKDVKIYVYGEKDDTLISELHKIVSELNDLIESVNIEIVTDSTKSNINIYFGSEEYICSVRPGKLVQDLATYAQGFAITYPYYNILNGSLVFVNTHRIENMVRKKHVLREELTQAFGFCHDSYKYPTSIFYELYSNVTSFSEIDKLVIARHYLK
jgi:hypothetical protein